jgi:regulator of sirC expression with transglutaminase-like and TPR domain
MRAYLEGAVHAPPSGCSPGESPIHRFGSAENLVDVISRIFDVPDDRIDYAAAKVAIDQVVDPQLDPAFVFCELDRLTIRAGELARGDSRPSVKLGAVKRLLYEAGPWNERRPFRYDANDPTGRMIRNKLLHNYLRTRLGQCVSMPVLFLIIAKRLGLNVALACAPEHVFVRYTDEGKLAHNLETTSGGHPARDQWYREKLPITDRSIESGIYLRSLSMREGVAVMASTAVDLLKSQGRFEEVIALCEILLRHHPNDVSAMLWLGSACGHLAGELQKKNPNPFAAPPEVRARAAYLMQRNRHFFTMAESLGWVPFK